MKRNIRKSDCCKAKMRVSIIADGTPAWFCTKCFRACARYIKLDAEAKKGVKKLDEIKPCKRCDKLNHKIKCLNEELEKHRQKHLPMPKPITHIGKSMQKFSNLCTSCNKPIQKVGVMMPSVNPKLRMRCLSCAEKEFFKDFDYRDIEEKIVNPINKKDKKVLIV